MVKVSTPQAPARRPWIFRDLPVFPAVALELIDILEDSATPIQPVLDLLKRDPALCAEVMRAANSAHFQRRERITDLHRAVSVVGNASTRRIALQAALRGLVSKSLGADELRQCWKHCIRTASLAEALAPYVDLTPASAYTAGLLHDIGRLALMAMYPEEYASLLRVSEAGRFPLLEAEAALFDINHCDAGAWLTDRWRLPEGLARIAAEHHADDGRSHSMLSVVAVAQNISMLNAGKRVAPTALDEATREWVGRLPASDPPEAGEAVLRILGEQGGF